MPYNIKGALDLLAYVIDHALPSSDLTFKKLRKVLFLKKNDGDLTLKVILKASKLASYKSLIACLIMSYPSLCMCVEKVIY